MKGGLKLPVDIDQWEKNSRETARVRLDRYRGIDTVDIRAWWPNADGELQPSRHGFTIRVTQLPRLLSAIQHATDLVTKLGLIDDSWERNDGP